MSSYIAYLQPMILFFYQCCCPHPKVHLLTTFRHQKLSQCHIPNVIDFILDLYQQHPELLCQTHDILTHHLFIHCTMLNLPPMIPCVVLQNRFCMVSTKFIPVPTSIYPSSPVSIGEINYENPEEQVAEWLESNKLGGHRARVSWNLFIMSGTNLQILNDAYVHALFLHCL